MSYKQSDNQDGGDEGEVSESKENRWKDKAFSSSLKEHEKVDYHVTVNNHGNDVGGDGIANVFIMDYNDVQDDPIVALRNTMDVHSGPCGCRVDDAGLNKEDTCDCGSGDVGAGSRRIAKGLETAFGRDGSCLGVCAISNIPGFVEAKTKFLHMAHSLAHLPQSYLDDNLTDETSTYNAGWSHGKERLRNDKPDIAKGSFYFNPLKDRPGNELDRAKYPASYPCNVWPDEKLIPGFQSAARELGRIMYEAVSSLSRHIDAYAASKQALINNHDCNTNMLSNAISKTEKVKGRLLYYFPLPPEKNEVPNIITTTDNNKDCHASNCKSSNIAHNEENASKCYTATNNSEDSWIGWHYDSGFITALAGDLYVNDTTGEIINNPDPLSGLYVIDRSKSKVRINIPSDCMGIQLGECVQIITGGLLVATPHCVRGPISCASADTNNVARVSFPCFVDTRPDFALKMPDGCTRQNVLDSGVGTENVPSLERRWLDDGMLFGDFLARTFAMYYESSQQKTNI